jgi:hypothetical protein
MFRETSDADVLDPTVSHGTSCRIVLHQSLVSDEPLAVTAVCHATALQGTASSADLSVDSGLVVTFGTGVAFRFAGGAAYGVVSGLVMVRISHITIYSTRTVYITFLQYKHCVEYKPKK